MIRAWDNSRILCIQVGVYPVSFRSVSSKDIDPGVKDIESEIRFVWMRRW